MNRIYAKVGSNLIPIHLSYPSDKTITLKFKYHPKLIEEVKAMESASWDADLKQWSVSNSLRNLYVLDQLERHYDARYDSPLEMTFEDGQLKAHQVEGVNHVLQRQRVILAFRMGLGKTLLALKVIERVRGKHLIVCPKNVKNVWRDEIKKWKVRVLEEGQTVRPGRGNASESIAEVKIISYEYLQQTSLLDPFPYDHVWFDEGHRLKNSETQRFKGAYLVAEKLKLKSNHSIIAILTGTPSPRDPTDWWALAEICQPGFLRESTKKKFEYRLAEHETMTGRGGVEFQKVSSWKEEELLLLPSRLKGMVLFKDKKDCLDLPPKTYQQIQLDFDQTIIKQLKSMIEIMNPGSSGFNALRQLSDGFNYSLNQDFECPKYEALLDLIEERDRIVIYAGFQRTVDKITDCILTDKEWGVIQLDGRGLKTWNIPPQDWQEWFNTKKDQRIAFVGHPQSGGIGLNLQASDSIIFVSNSSNPVDRPQAEDRIHRLGMGASALITDLFWLPIDKYCWQLIQNSRNLESVSLGEIKEWINQELDQWK